MVKYNRKSFWKLRPLLEVSKQYKKTKAFFKKASRSKKKADWRAAFRAYQEYHEKYDKDIDALLEFGEICVKLGKYEEAIKHFTASAVYQKNNPFHLMRIGEVYARHQSYEKMKDQYLKLFRKDPTKKAYIINYAVACIKDQDKKQLNYLISKYPKGAEIKISTSNDEEKKDLLEVLKESLKRLESNSNASEPYDLEQNIIYTKGKGGENSLSHHEQRLGVLLLLKIFPGVTKERIREEWLKNADTTNDILTNLLDDQHIKKHNLGKAEMYYLTEVGKKVWELEQKFKVINELIEKKEKIQAGPITDRLIKAVNKWNSYR